MRKGTMDMVTGIERLVVGESADVMKTGQRVKFLGCSWVEWKGLMEGVAVSWLESAFSHHQPQPLPQERPARPLAARFQHRILTSYANLATSVWPTTTADKADAIEMSSETAWRIGQDPIRPRREQARHKASCIRSICPASEILRDTMLQAGTRSDAHQFHGLLLTLLFLFDSEVY